MQLLLIGDSKTAQDGWSASLTAALGFDTAADNRAVSGSTVADWAGYIATKLASPRPTRSPTVLINLGVNDMTGGLPAEATWKADYTTVIHTIHSVMPDSPVYLMRPWKQGYDADAATLNTWIADLVAADPTYVHTGPDEAVWLKGSDNGATNTSDGIHYSTAGKAACVTAWDAVIP